MGKHGANYDPNADIPGPIDPRDHHDKSPEEQADALLSAAQFDASWHRNNRDGDNAS